MKTTWRLLAIWLAIASLAIACAPRAPAADVAPLAPEPGRQKHLVMGILQEPKGWGLFADSSSAGGAQQPVAMLTRTLTIVDGDGSIAPVLAESIPSVEKGDWLINSGGTMEQTWRIRSNARWHDGQPVTADDFVLGWEILADPGLPARPSSVARQVASATAPDPTTLVLRFKSTTPAAKEALHARLPGVPVDVEAVRPGMLLDVELLSRGPRVYKPVVTSDWRRPGRQLLTVGEGLMEWPRPSFGTIVGWLRRLLATARRRRQLRRRFGLARAERR